MRLVIQVAKSQIQVWDTNVSSVAQLPGPLLAWGPCATLSSSLPAWFHFQHPDHL